MTSTTVLTFRVDSKDMNALRKLARDDHISVSALVSQVLKSYIEWDHISVKIGMIPMQKESIKELLDSAPDDVLEKIVVHAANKFMGELLLMTGKSTLDSFLRITRIRLEKSGFYMSESMQDGKLQLTIQHGMGRKWSVFFSKYHDNIIRQLGYDTEAEVKDDLWVIRIETR
jgi:hypothetical protein